MLILFAWWGRENCSCTVL